MKSKKINPWWYAAGFGVLLVIVWLFEFVLSSDKPCTVTGWDAMNQLSTSFWIWLIVLSSVGGFIIRYAIRKYKKDGGVDTGNIQSLLAVGAFLIIISTLKAYDVKANCGTTGTKGNPANQHPKDDGRIPAQDMIPK